MYANEKIMGYKIDFIMISLLFLTGGVNILAGLGSLTIIIYYLSMLKINVVDKKYKGNWIDFFKSWVVKKQKQS